MRACHSEDFADGGVVVATKSTEWIECPGVDLEAIVFEAGDGIVYVDGVDFDKEEALPRFANFVSGEVFGEVGDTTVFEAWQRPAFDIGEFETELGCFGCLGVVDGGACSDGIRHITVGNVYDAVLAFLDIGPGILEGSVALATYGEGHDGRLAAYAAEVTEGREVEGTIGMLTEYPGHGARHEGLDKGVVDLGLRLIFELQYHAGHSGKAE